VPKPNRRHSVAVLLAVFLVVLFRPVDADRKVDLSRFVVVGDSLAAGFQNFSLVETQQVNGAANLVAQQANIPLELPLVPYPGIPNVLTLVSAGVPPVVAPVPDPPPAFPRLNPATQATNLAVPGHTLADAIFTRPGVTADLLTNTVLGFPTPFLVPGAPLSQMESAVALSPTFILIWIGNNDSFFPAIVGNVAFLTPVSTFAALYHQLSQTLAQTDATMVMVNIPDVTANAYFTSLEKLSAQAGAPAAIVGPLLGMQPGDYLQPSGLPTAFAILGGQMAGPLPAVCPLAIPGNPFTQVPCVLTANDVAVIRATIQAYNQVIAASAQRYGAALVDLNARVSDLVERGYKAGSHRLTGDFLGGLFSLDGVHPTNTGYAILANEILEQMKRQLHINIPKVNVTQVAKQDPLVF
jgi:GDSL-like lipase/acylhydrolase family protein